MLRFFERECGVGSLLSLGAWQILSKSYYVSHYSISQSIYNMISPYILSIVIYIHWSNVVLRALTLQFLLRGSWGAFQCFLPEEKTIFTVLYDISGEQRLWIWIWNGYRNNPQTDQIHVWQQRERRHQLFSLGRESYSTVGKWEFFFSFTTV